MGKKNKSTNPPEKGDGMMATQQGDSGKRNNGTKTVRGTGPTTGILRTRAISEIEKSGPIPIRSQGNKGDTSPNLGLDYIRPASEGNQLIVEIEEDDITSELEYWKNAVVCYVIGAHPPFSVLNGYIQRQWGKWGINKIAMLKNGIMLVRFDSAEGKNEVIQGGIYHFDNKPLIVKAWDADMDFSREELYSVPIWIKLPALDFKYWSAKGLSKIGSLVGKPLMVDKNTEKKVGLNFAKLLVEVKIGSALPDTIYFRNERGKVIEQKVMYDWKPSMCSICQKYGHTAEICRRNKANEKKVELQLKENTTKESNGTEADQEQLVGSAGKHVGSNLPQQGKWRKQVGRRQYQDARLVLATTSGTNTVPVANSFQPLENARKENEVQATQAGQTEGTKNYPSGHG
ncbi:uncharacterized protein LOC132639151 [Lycium barbarum]|uniref:uncharacterized protein LOC132639151 n=1 Tax=Lycium barbarum TaxID=112863 RepID=UPI00293E7E0B|nr:uncharacterized protein LOC132639151 [Lycium barbarum]